MVTVRQKVAACMGEPLVTIASTGEPGGVGAGPGVGPPDVIVEREDGADYGEPATSHTQAEMEGALADLRFLAGFLGAVGREREASELPERDWQLSRVAAEMAGEVAALVERLDRELRRPKGECL